MSRFSLYVEVLFYSFFSVFLIICMEFNYKFSHFYVKLFIKLLGGSMFPSNSVNM